MAPDNGESAGPTAANPTNEAVADAEAAAEAAKARAEAARARAIELRRKAEEARTAAAADAVAVEEPPVPAEPDVFEVAAAADVDSVSDTTGDTAELKDEAHRAPVRTPKRRRPLPRPRWSLVAAAVGVVALCGLIAASGFLVHAHRQTELNGQRSAEYTAAARQGVVNIMAINFNSADADVQRVLESATGDFKQDFQSSSKDLISALKEAKVITEVTVEGVAVESMTPESAVVLVAATSQRGNTDAQNRDPRTWRVVVSLAREGDQLKVAKVDYV